MKNFQVASLIQWATMLVWALLLIPAYLMYSPYYLDSLEVLTGGGIMLALLAATGIVAVMLQGKDNRWLPYVSRPWKGWQLYLSIFVVQVILFGWYLNYYQPLDAAGGNPYAIVHMATQTLLQHGFLVLTVLLAWMTGNWVGQLIFRESPAWTLSVAIGWSLQIPVLLVLGALGLFAGWWPWLVVLVLAIPGYKTLLPALRQGLWQSRQPFTMVVWGWPLLLLLLLFVAANLTGINRPVPVGFDAINFYVNIPHLLATDGQLVTGGQPYGWSLIMALGFAGFNSTAMALSLSVLPGILAAFVTYRIARRYLSIAYSLLAAALVYTLPVITWQSTQEAKVDMALLFFLLVTVDTLLAGKNRRSWVWIVAGWLLGTALSIKFTALFVALGAVVYVGYVTAGASGLLLMAGAGLSGIFLLGIYRFAPIGLQLSGSLWVGGLLLIAGVAGGFLLRRKSNTDWRSLAIGLSCVGGVAMLAFSPWLIKNVVETGTFSLKTMLTGQPLYPEIPPLEKMTPDDPLSLQVWMAGHPALAQRDGMPTDLAEGKRLSTDMYEEVARYMGYEPVLARYLTLPYDVSMRRNVTNYAVDTGFWLLLLLPLLLVGGKGSLWSWTLGGGLLAFLWLSISVYGAGEWTVDPVWPELTKPLHAVVYSVGALFQGLWIAVWAAKPAVAFPIMAALLAVVAVISYRQGISREDIPVWIFTGMAGISWWWLGSGIPWYGLIGFALGAIALLIIVRKVDDENRWLSRFLLGLLGIWLMMAAVQRLQSPDPLNKSNQTLYSSVFAKYIGGELSTGEVEGMVTQQWAPTLAVINAEQTGKILRFGTFINYYIAHNNKRVILDNQLNNFDYLYGFVDGDPERLYDLLELLDIRYIVMSLKVGDDTDEQLLAQKAQRLMEFIRYHFEKVQPGIRLIHTDQNPALGQAGTYASYELLFYE